MGHLLQTLAILSQTSQSFLPGELFEILTFSEVWSPPPKLSPPPHFLQHFQTSFIVWLFLAKLKTPMRRDVILHIFVPHQSAAPSWPGQLRWMLGGLHTAWVVLCPVAFLGLSVPSLFILRGMDGALKAPGPSGSGIWGSCVGPLLQEVLWDVVQLLQGPSHGFLCHNDRL